MYLKCLDTFLNSALGLSHRVKNRGRLISIAGQGSNVIFFSFDLPHPFSTENVNWKITLHSFCYPSPLQKRNTQGIDIFYVHIAIIEFLR